MNKLYSYAVGAALAACLIFTAATVRSCVAEDARFLANDAHQKELAISYAAEAAKATSEYINELKQLEAKGELPGEAAQFLDDVRFLEDECNMDEATAARTAVRNR